MFAEDVELLPKSSFHDLLVDIKDRNPDMFSHALKALWETMNPDQSFAQNRLLQLAEQLLKETTITGDLVFFVDEDEGRIGGATWRFEDGDQTLLKDSGFKFMLMELLDSLILRRASEESTDSLNGVVHLEQSSPSIQWLTAEEAENKVEKTDSRCKKRVRQ